MTTIQMRGRVDKSGNVIVPVGVAEAGTEVQITVQPAGAAITEDEYRRRLEQTAGSIDDPTFVRPPQWDITEREPLE